MCIARILLAIACGGVIGLERTKRSKEAGIRTHCILAASAALLMIISKYGFRDIVSDGVYLYGTKDADAARVAASVVAGIGFLCSGVIFRNGNTVKGLTTAAGIMATAAVGMACGAGLYVVAIFCTLCVVAIQLLLHRFSVGNDAFSNSEIHIVFEDSTELRKVLKKKCEELEIHIVSSRIICTSDGCKDMVLMVRQKRVIPFEEVLKFMDENPGIRTLNM